ncbi:MAG: hypothetical protein JXJ04_05820 [Spirochaetales bacterium]|nr:hypothetical protein [Spirochaetales bacterium]
MRILFIIVPTIMNLISSVNGIIEMVRIWPVITTVSTRDVNIKENKKNFHFILEFPLYFT